MTCLQTHAPTVEASGNAPGSLGADEIIARVRSEGNLLGPRWESLRPVKKQQELWRTRSRFCTVPSGRRSGKTEIAKRRLVYAALCTTRDSARFVACAPTHNQAREIYWDDLRKLVPSWAMLGDPVLTPIPTIRLINGARIQVFGMDRPARIEGSPVDGGIMDEYADMRKEAWTNHVRPALSTLDRLGWCWFIGVPDGRNHYWKLDQRAKKDGVRWSSYHWPAWDVLPASEIESAKQDLDELTFRQEYGGEFVDFSGRAYYQFDHRIHSRWRIPYSPSLPLRVSLDFNVSPGVALFIQERRTTEKMRNWFRDEHGLTLAEEVTAVVGEVWIERNSNSYKIAEAICRRFPKHTASLLLYGDASGGARTSSSVAGSDWDLIHQVLHQHYGRENVKVRYPRGKANPPIRSTVVSVNSRLRNAFGEVRMLVSPEAEHLITDLEGVEVDDHGDLMKPKSGELTHISDALRYYVQREHPTRGGNRLGFVDMA